MSETWNTKFWKNWADAVKRLPEGERGAFLEKWLDYTYFDEEPEFEGVEAMLWDFMQPVIDKDKKLSKSGHKTGNKKKKAANKTVEDTSSTVADTVAETVSETVAEKPSVDTVTTVLEKPSSDTVGTVSFIEAEAEIEAEEEAEKEAQPLSRENAGSSSGNWIKFLKQCIDEYNSVMETNVLDFPFEAREGIRRIYSNGRTMDDVRKVLEYVKSEWKPRYITPKSVFGDKFETNLNRPKPKKPKNKEAPPPQEYPQTARCPECGKEAPLVVPFLGQYECECGNVWEVA